jgi:hypothetical protein
MSVNKKFRKYINTAFILGPMTMIMGLIGVLRNYGLHEGWVLKFSDTQFCGYFIQQLIIGGQQRIVCL